MNKHLRDERDICYQVCFVCEFHSLDYLNLSSQFILFLPFLKRLQIQYIYKNIRLLCHIANKHCDSAETKEF